MYRYIHMYAMYLSKFLQISGLQIFPSSGSF